MDIKGSVGLVVDASNEHSELIQEHLLGENSGVTPARKRVQAQTSDPL
jgi:hypothetical protein